MKIQRSFTCILYICPLAITTSLKEQSPYQISRSTMSKPVITFSNTWDVLGPFQIGTREAAWGADPLEYHGGFSSLEPASDSVFKSSLTVNGTVSWSTTHAKSVEDSDAGSKTKLSFSFPDVDWPFLQSIYGWSALQWQGWARGEILVTSDEPVTTILYTDQVLEYVIDDVKHFGGDFFTFKKAPLVLTLAPGKHVLDLRLIREVRAMGGVGLPILEMDLEIQQTSADVELADSRVLVSDVVDGRLSSPYGTVTIRNSGQHWIEIFKITDAQPEVPTFTASLWGGSTRTIAPGQTRPVSFLLQISGDTSSPLPDKQVTLSYRLKGGPEKIQSLTFTIKLTSKSQYEPHKVTHLHPSGIVSYAILRAPARNATCFARGSSYRAPVMLQLHGAGLEAENELVAHALDSLPDLCAWVVFPTGVTPWSGDDWHNWGFSDVEAAIANIPSWIEATNWQGVGIDTSKWLVTGHSNGGQGTWYTLLHHPDNVFAAAPVSGYSSIQEYVPYKFWKPSEPKKRAILEATTNSYRHELLVSNAYGIPIQQQHGSADDNVPVYHSRLMSQLIAETGWSSNYSEVAGQPHWWETIMTTDVLSQFYRDQLATVDIPRKTLKVFELVVANPGDTGSKGGIKVLYLINPAELGRIVASQSETTRSWSLETSNIMAIELDDSFLEKPLVLNGVKVELKVVSPAGVKVQLFRDEEGNWTKTKPSSALRRRDHLGGLDAILRTKGAFNIVYNGHETLSVALELSRNLFQYFYADSELSEGHELPSQSSGNRISISIGDSSPESLYSGDFAMILRNKLAKSYPLLDRRLSGSPVGSDRGGSEVGAVFLRPLAGVLEMVIWGSTPRMLAQIARLAPLLTGTGQPDFIIMDRSASWRGVDGASLGFLDASWNITDSSSLTLTSPAAN